MPREDAERQSLPSMERCEALFRNACFMLCPHKDRVMLICCSVMASAKSAQAPPPSGEEATRGAQQELLPEPERGGENGLVLHDEPLQAMGVLLRSSQLHRQREADDQQVRATGIEQAVLCRRNSLA